MTAARDAEGARTPGAEVRAAGGLVRRWDGREWRLVVVHRPRYDDWSLPKGKADGDEPDAETARREVYEETGLRCALLEPAGTTRYRDSRDRPKIVTYWWMEPTTVQTFTANDEVDELRWCTVPEALALLSYPHDRELLTEAAAALADS